MSKNKDFIIENGVLVKYTGNDKFVIIPNEVTIIGESAFANCNSVEFVLFPDGLTTIKDYAFSNCINFKGSLVYKKLDDYNK